MIPSQSPPISRLASLAWRYRQELLPVWTGLAFLAVSSVAHLVARNAWPLALPLGAAATAGWRWRASGKRDQTWALVLGSVATLWFTAAWWSSPWRGSLVVVLVLGLIPLAVPRWRPGRRPQAAPTPAAASDGRVSDGRPVNGRMGDGSGVVRDLRGLARDWPMRSAAADLAGSSIEHMDANEHGCALTLALRPGQTVADVVARMPRLESVLQAPPGAVEVASDPDRADRCRIRVIWNDPLATPVPWRVPSGQSIADPLRLGVFGGGGPVELTLLGEHMLVAGAAGRGKSGLMNVVLAELAARGDAVLWAVDCRDGLELAPWQLVLDRWAVTAEEGTAMLQSANRVVDARARLLAAQGERRWRPTPEEPALVVLLDELTELTAEAIELCERLVRRGRPLGIVLVIATHRPSAAPVLGGLDLRTQVGVRACLGLTESRDVDRILGAGRWAAGWCAERLRLPGSFLIHVPGRYETPRPARAFWLSEDEVSRTASRYATDRPRLDPASATAAGELPVSSALVVER